MKKPFLIFASVLLAVMSYAGAVSIWAESSVVAASSTVKLYISPANAGVTSGYTTVLQLRLYKNSSAKVDYAEAHVSFPVSNLEVVSISKQGSYFNNGGGPSISYNNSNGLISVMGSGPELGMVDDVLVATVTFKGKTAGTAAVSYTSASQAGDITNGGHVKNVLDTRVGATVNITNPAPTHSGGSTGTPTTGSSTPTATSSPTTTPSAPAPTTSDATATTTIPATAQSTSDTSTPKDVSASLERTVTAPPAWLQFLLPAAGGVGLLGLGGLGYVLYLKRRKSGVSLPPEEELGIQPMPSTETQDADTPVFGLGSELAEQEAPQEDPVQSEDYTEEPDLPEFSTREDISTSPAPSIPDPASLESVLSQPAELLPSELQDTVIPETMPLPEAPVPEQAFSQPVAAELQPPLPTAAPPVEPAGAPEAPIASTPVIQAAVPAQAPVSAPSDSPVVAPAPLAQPDVPATPVAEPPQSIQTPPVTTSYPQPTAPVAAAPAVAIDPNAPIDYKNLPDMYDEGEQRLQKEGFGDVARPVSKAQPV